MNKLSTEVEYVPISDIRPNPYQPRKKFNDIKIDELGQSIKSYGIIQPLSVRKLNNSYELVAGERRLRAAEKIGLKEVPVIIVEFGEEESALVALMENLQREDLNYIEEAIGYYNLIEDHGLTQGEIAKKIGKSQSTIANKLRILQLPLDIQRELIEEKLSERHGRALLKLPTYELKKETLQIVKENNLNVRQTEELIESILEEIIDEKEEVIEEKEKIKKKQKVKSLINTRIYLNTMKNAYKAIKETGIEADYKEIEKEDYVEVRVRIPKN